MEKTTTEEIEGIVKKIVAKEMQQTVTAKDILRKIGENEVVVPEGHAIFAGLIDPAGQCQYAGSGTATQALIFIAAILAKVIENGQLKGVEALPKEQEATPKEQEKAAD